MLFSIDIAYDQLATVSEDQEHGYISEATSDQLKPTRLITLRIKGNHDNQQSGIWWWLVVRSTKYTLQFL